MTHSFDAVDELSINTIRTLSMDAVQRANSGHPGAPMGLAPVAHVLYSRILKHDPASPGWPDRDRFVLSCGHASMLLYSALHVFGYDLGIEDLKGFRQWGSRTPGHPEHGMVPGVEVTTGPLGQGCATSVGLALAEAHLAEVFNRPGHPVVDHHTWVLCSDGDLMEGLSAEAASLAGHLGLGKLNWIWDDNRITIEGETGLAISEDTRARFVAYGWHVVDVADVNDLDRLSAALEEARETVDRPSLVAVRSRIAFGAPTKEGTAGAHGAPLGEDEIEATKRAYGWPEAEPFTVPDEVRTRCREAADRGAEAHARWDEARTGWAAEHGELAGELDRRLAGRLAEGWRDGLPGFAVADGPMATRAASGKVLNGVASFLPELVGGSADLAPSCKTVIEGSAAVSRGAFGGRNLHFGIREQAMTALLNGLALHGGVRPYGATFLVFADYMRPAIRLAAIMEQPAIYVLTHDSIFVGEDGPTHQPVEHLLALRAIPGLVVLRPCDAKETAAAWAAAIEEGGPVALVLSRQKLPVLDNPDDEVRAGTARGAWIVVEASGSRPDVVLVATGSEVHLACEAAGQLNAEGVATRVVSMPSWGALDRQDESYRREVLPPGVPSVAVEAGVTRGWSDYVDAAVGIDRFGASAPGATVARELGLHAEAVVAAAKETMMRGTGKDGA